jgi:large subunit ribosomal protein L25
MTESAKIRVEPRDPVKNKGTGSRVARRLRAAGRIPAVIYGHKKAVIPVSLVRGDVWKMIKTPGHLADIEVGGLTETVLIRDVQWDHLGKEILHLDFSRVSAEEVIETEVAVELRGQAAGVANGGILEHLVHSLSINCRAGAIPDSIKIDVSQLDVDQGIHVRDLILPTDVTVNADAEVLLVHVVMRAAAEEPAAPEAETAAGPEVIKPERKEKDKED